MNKYRNMKKVMFCFMTVFGMMSCVLNGCGSQPTDYASQRESAEENIDSDEDKVKSSADTEAGDDQTEEQTDNKSYGELSEGDAAPDFAADLVSGDKFVLSENSGRVVLLNLWATWCGPCVEEMPAFEKLNSEYGDEVIILGVNCVENKNTVDGFIEENGYTFPIAYDLDGIITHRYPTQGIPYTLVIGKDGVIKNIYLGSAGMEQQYQTYKTAIDAALAE